MHLVDLDISVADAAPLWFEDIDADTTTVREEFYGNFFKNRGPTEKGERKCFKGEEFERSNYFKVYFGLGPSV